jgi:hypothetical protein
MQSPKPEAAVLAAALHGKAGDTNAARLGLRAIRGLPFELRRRHTITILAALPKPQRDELIGELPVEERDELMEIERQSGTYHVGLEQGIEQGIEQGRRAALIEVALALLEDRGVTVDPASVERLHQCDDLSVLQRWVRRASSATSLDELFDS